MEKERIEKAIRDHCIALGMKINHQGQGYVSTNEENLIQIFHNWDIIKAEIETGQGNELKGDEINPPKFNAVLSSSALGVNNFAPFKEHINQFCFYNYTDFKEGTFEKKLPTGISTPNLDFYLEGSYNVIGIESKFTENLYAKLPNQTNRNEKQGNLEKYLNRKKLSFLPDGYEQTVIEFYKDYDRKMHLDVAQLIKHAIGLINKASTKYKFILNQIYTNPVLVYIYWQPSNWYAFDIYKHHEQEIEEFKRRIDPFIHFIPISYLEFWKIYEKTPLFSAHIEKVKRRYYLKA